MSDTTDDLTKPQTAAPTVDDFAEDFGAFEEFDPPPAPPAPPAPRSQRRAAQAQPAEDVEETKAQGLPEGFEATVRVKGPKAKPQPKADDDGKRPDPLAWLSDARVGTIRIVRKAGNGVDGEGKATRGLFKGKYVGLGECGMLDISSAEDVLEQIRYRWGGGNYQVTHLDGQNQPGRSVPLNLPQDPKPVEGSRQSDEDEDEDGNGDEDVITPYPRDQRLLDPRLDPRLDPYDDPRFDPRFQQQQPPRVWRPAYQDENEREEERTVAKLLEEERERRLALEAQIEREKITSKHEREMAELRALVTQQRPGKDPMELFLTMMAEQTRQSQERFEREARERRERDEREARERKEQMERERRDREAERARQDALFAQQQQQNQQFMQMVLGQKQSLGELVGLVEKMTPKQTTDQLTALTQAFELVERARDIASPGGGGDEDEGGIAGAIRAATPALKPLAEGVVRAMTRGSEEPPPPPPRRINVQQPQQPQPPALPAPVPAPEPAKKDTATVIGQVAKIVGVVAQGWESKQEPDKIAAAIVGYAAGIGATEEVEQIAASDLKQIHTQLTLVKNMGLPNEAVGSIDAFLAIYTQPGGQQWLAQVLSALGSDGE